MHGPSIMTKRLVNKPLGCSEFQLHKNTLPPMPEDLKAKLVDFTEHKLRRMIMTTPESERRRVLLCLLADYQQGKIAVAWQNGTNPIYVTVRKDDAKS